MSYEPQFVEGAVDDLRAADRGLKVKLRQTSDEVLLIHERILARRT